MIDRLPLVEDKNVLMLAQRHTFSVEMSRHAVFLPDEVVPPQLRLRQHEPCGEKSLPEQDDGAVRLGYPMVLLPQGIQRYRVVPSRRTVAPVQCPVRHIRNHGIDAVVRNLLHALKAVHSVNMVSLYHGVSVVVSLICRALIHVQRPVRVIWSSHRQRVFFSTCLKLTSPSLGP